MNVLKNLLGADIQPLINEIKQFSKTQQQIIALLEEIKQIQTQTLFQLGGKMPDQLKPALNSALLEEPNNNKLQELK